MLTQDPNDASRRTDKIGTAQLPRTAQEGPAWPDRFGEAIRSQLEAIDPTPTLSLFSGGGGLDIGFHDAGFAAIEAVEIDPRYAATLEANRRPGQLLEGTRARCLDIGDYEPPRPARTARFVIGGPPCQTFSAAGRRASGVSGTDDARGLLFREYVRLLEEVQPDGFLFENVYGIIGAQGGRAWGQILESFEQLGYEIAYRVLDAADYGVPQHRERLIVVGSRGEPFLFPTPTHGPDSTADVPFYRAGEAVASVEHDAVPGPVRGRYGHLLKEIPPGLNYSYFTKEMGHPRPVFAWRSKFSDLLYKADPERPVRTIKAQGGQYTGPFSWANRPFSTAELKRLQTIPDAYQLIGSPRVAAQQIGNSVPPQLARILALAVGEQLFDRVSPVPLEYLDPSEKLGFRKRKRALTAHYRKVAATAIANLPSTRPSSRQSARQSTKWRTLGNDFGWRPGSRGKEGSLRILVETRPTTLKITLGDERPGGRLSIRPTEGEWPLPIKRAELLFGKRPTELTAAWKAFEEEVRDRFGYADLVQLSGYYAYAPKLEAALVKSPDDGELWHLLERIMLGQGVGLTASLKQLSALWQFEPDLPSLRRLLRELRALGFEVRSSRTNPQIPRGQYLVPYSFPTFAPASVQRSKLL